MSSTNTTLATLAGGFVPMLLKNVLNSKGAKLSLKTVSFKGQIDEIIDEYKQFWPVLDLLVERDIPEEEEKKDEDGEEGGEGGEKEEEKNKDSNDNMKKDDKNGETKDSKGNGEVLKEKKVNFKDDKEEKGGESKGGKDDKGSDSKDKKGAEGGKDGNGDKDKNASDHSKWNGDVISGVGVLHATSLEEEGMVDLFIDLSVADTAGWSIYGSSESIPNSDEEDTIMPGYFNANQVDPPAAIHPGRLSVRYQPRQSIVPT